MDDWRRRKRRQLAQRFHVAHIANHVAWAPFAGIEDLGSEVPGALLFDRKLKVSDHTFNPQYPTLGS